MAKKKIAKSLALSVGNPELADPMRGKTSSGAAGFHDTRPKGRRERSNAKRNAIAESRHAG